MTKSKISSHYFQGPTQPHTNRVNILKYRLVISIDYNGIYKKGFESLVVGLGLATIGFGSIRDFFIFQINNLLHYYQFDKAQCFIKYKHINDIHETSIEFLMIFAEEWSLTFNLMMVVSGRLSKLEEEKVNSEEFFLSPVVVVGLGLGAIMAWIHFLLSSRSTLVQRASPLLHGLSIRTS